MNRRGPPSGNARSAHFGADESSARLAVARLFADVSPSLQDRSALLRPVLADPSRRTEDDLDQSPMILDDRYRQKAAAFNDDCSDVSMLNWISGRPVPGWHRQRVYRWRLRRNRLPYVVKPSSSMPVEEHGAAKQTNVVNG